MRNAMRRLVATIGAGALAALAVCGSAAAGPSHVATALADDLTLTVTHFGPAVMTSGQAINVGTTVKNTSLRDLTGLSVTLGVTALPIADRSQLAPWLAGELDLGTRAVARSVVGTGKLEPLGSAVVTVVASSSTLGFPDSSWGVYGVSVSLESDGATVETSYGLLTWLDTTVVPIPVSVIVLASGTPERVDALIAASDHPGVTVAVDPTGLTEANAARIGARPAYLLPSGSVDVASLASAESSELLEWAIDDARSSAPRALAGEPWLAIVSAIDSTTFARAAELGAGAVLALPSSDTALDVGVWAVAGDPARVPVLIPDPGLSAALESGPADNPLAPARVVAESALAARDHANAGPMVVVVGSEWSVEPDHSSPTLDALLTSPWVTPTAMPDALAEFRSPDIALAAPVGRPSDIPLNLVSRANDATTGLVALADASSDPSVVLGAALRELASASSVDRGADPLARDAAIVTVLEAIETTLARVHIADGSTLTLISRSGNVPITVDNTLDVDVTVVVVLTSRSANLRVKDAPTVTVAAGTSQQVLVPVTAVSSANVIVQVSLESITGERLTSITPVHMRIRAEWGDVFTLVVASLTVLLLIAGTIRTVRRGRSEARDRPFVGPDSPHNG